MSDVIFNRNMNKHEKSFVDFVLATRNLVYRIIPRKLDFKMTQLYFSRKKFKKLDWLTLNIYPIGKCNLDCVSCSAFAPVADDYMLDINTFKSDCERLSELDDKKTIVKNISIAGGEPLMYPQLMDMLRIARNCLPETKLRIITNGILLLKQDERFWDCLKLNGVDLIISHYPIKLNIKSIKETAKKHGVSVMRYSGKLPWWKMTFDLSGSHDPVENYRRCPSAIMCMELKDGKITTCQTIMKARYFNNHFKQNLKIFDSDMIDIHKVKSIDEILEFVTKPTSFCRYCNVKRIPIKWGASKKELSEWV